MTGGETIVVLPHGDDLGAILGRLEDRLLWLDPDGDVDLEHVELAEQAADSLGRLAALVSRFDRHDPATRPVAPDGRLELAPLLFVPVTRNDLQAIGALTRALDDPSVCEWVVGAGGDDITRTLFERVTAMLELEHDEHDVAALQARLDRGAATVGPPTERIVLTSEESGAYRRVVGCLADALAGDSPLDRALRRYGHLGVVS